jgi:hypothetical protein
VPRHQEFADDVFEREPRRQQAGNMDTPANAYLSFGAVRATGSVTAPSNMKIQDQGFNESLGN